MAKMIPFTKMHGCGNDYIYVDCFQNKIENPADLARAVSDRHFGVGSDGLILICPSDIADVKMRIFNNSDGSEAEMCGNGIRCVAKFAYENGLAKKNEISVETLAGIKYLSILEDGNVRVNMGAPVVGENMVVETYPGTVVSMGNPHFVIVLDGDNESLKKMDLAKIGPLIENAPVFPNKTNTEFIRVVDKNNILMRVWERGAGETLACGTGACASAAACITDKLTDNQVSVHLLGGKLLVEWNKSENNIYMTGDAEKICSGEYYFSQKER
jgi:diaminopimelate epimerase